MKTLFNIYLSSITTTENEGFWHTQLGYKVVSSKLCIKGNMIKETKEKLEIKPEILKGVVRDELKRSDEMAIDIHKYNSLKSGDVPAMDFEFDAKLDVGRFYGQITIPQSRVDECKVSDLPKLLAAYISEQIKLDASI